GSADALVDAQQKIEELGPAPERKRALNFAYEGRLGEAQFELAEARRAVRDRRDEAVREATEEAAREEASLLTVEARLAEAQLRFAEAATLYAEAADLAAPIDPEWAWFIVFGAAEALLNDGRLFGDAESVTAAIQTLERC